MATVKETIEQAESASLEELREALLEETESENPRVTLTDQLESMIAEAEAADAESAPEATDAPESGARQAQDETGTDESVPAQELTDEQAHAEEELGPDVMHHATGNYAHLTTTCGLSRVGFHGNIVVKATAAEKHVQCGQCLDILRAE